MVFFPVQTGKFGRERFLRIMGGRNSQLNMKLESIHSIHPPNYPHVKPYSVGREGDILKKNQSPALTMIRFGFGLNLQVQFSVSAGFFF